MSYDIVSKANANFLSKNEENIFPYMNITKNEISYFDILQSGSRF